jgi:uncharacterized protein YndB with AHSA1/START domain
MSITETLEFVTPEGEPVIELRCFVKAPPELLFEVWTKPEHVRNWWGPERLATIECDIDLRVGGQWRCVHQAPDGQTFAFYGEYLEIEPPHKLVRTWIWEGMPDQAAIELVYFEAADGGTVIHGTTTHPSVEARDQHLTNGMEEGMRDTFRRLTELVAALVG